jgi:hypothetical protein
MVVSCCLAFHRPVAYNLLNSKSQALDAYEPYLPLLRRRPKAPCALLPRLRQAAPARYAARRDADARGRHAV